MQRTFVALDSLDVCSGLSCCSLCASVHCIDYGGVHTSHILQHLNHCFLSLQEAAQKLREPCQLLPHHLVLLKHLTYLLIMLLAEGLDDESCIFMERLVGSTSRLIHLTKIWN